MYKEKYFQFFPESDFRVRAKTSDENIILNIKSGLFLANNSLMVEVYCTSEDGGTKLICSREYEGVEEIVQFPSDKSIKEIFGGRTKAVANSYPIHSKISTMTTGEFYEYVEEKIGVYK